MRLSVRIGLAAVVLIGIVCYALNWDAKRIGFNLAMILPESVLQRLYEEGAESVYPALIAKQSNKGLADRVTFYSRMAERGVPFAACTAADYLGNLGHLEDQKNILEKYALKGDVCSAIQRFYWGNDPAHNVKWLELAIKNDPKECGHVEGKKYRNILIPAEIEQLCQKPCQNRCR